MTPSDGNHRQRQVLAAALRQAFTEHGRHSKREWSPEVQAVTRGAPPSEDPEALVVRIRLTLADTNALIAILRSGAMPKASGEGVPVTWLNTREVAELLGISQSTIRSRCHNGEPHDDPFPQPQKRQGRNHWDQVTVLAWAARREEINARRKQQRGRRKEA